MFNMFLNRKSLHWNSQCNTIFCDHVFPMKKQVMERDRCLELYLRGAQYIVYNYIWYWLQKRKMRSRGPEHLLYTGLTWITKRKHPCHSNGSFTSAPLILFDSHNLWDKMRKPLPRWLPLWPYPSVRDSNNGVWEREQALCSGSLGLYPGIATYY